MARGETQQSKMHFKGAQDDFIIFLDDVEAFKKWQTDSSIPLAHFISAFQIFVTHKQGAQGSYDTASKSTLAAEFSSEDVEECIKQILAKGNLQTMDMPERQGTKNDSMGAGAAH